MASGQLRVVHLAREHAALDILLDGEPRLAALRYGQASAYLTLPVGAHTLAARPTGEEPSVPSTAIAVELSAGACWTIVLPPAAAAPLVLADESFAPMGGPPQVRLVHAADGAPAVDLAVSDGPTLVQSLAFATASPYVDAPAGTRGVIVRPAGGGDLLASIPDATLVPDTAYTLIVARATADAAPLTLLPLVDGYPPLRFPARTPPRPAGAVGR
jgi:hypothetical protein